MLLYPLEQKMSEKTVVAVLILAFADKGHQDGRFGRQ